MPRPRCSLTPTGVSPVSQTLLNIHFEEEMGERCGAEGTLCLAEVGPLVGASDVNEKKKQKLSSVGTRPQKGMKAPRKLSKTVLESLLLHEIRALDRMAHLRETEVTEKFWCSKTDTVQARRCVPRRDIAGWLVSDGLDAAKVLQSRLVLRNITLQLMEGSQVGEGGHTPDGMSPRADALPVRILPDLPLYLGSGSSAKHADVLRAYGISRVVNVSAVVPNYHEGVGSISYVKVPVYDAEDVDIIGALKDHRVMEFIREGLEGGQGVLVHCCAGRSRSVACVCAYLISRYGWTVEEALEAVRRVRVVSPNAGFLEQLELFRRACLGECMN